MAELLQQETAVCLFVVRPARYAIHIITPLDVKTAETLPAKYETKVSRAAHMIARISNGILKAQNITRYLVLF